MVFGRTLRDHIPCLPYNYAVNADWCISQELKKRMMAKSREVDSEKLARNTRSLQCLPIGTPVAIQNQSGGSLPSGTRPAWWLKSDLTNKCGESGR